MPLDINGKEYQKVIEKIERESESGLGLDVNTEGASVEVNKEFEDISVIAYLKAKWRGEKIAGGRIRWKF